MFDFLEEEPADNKITEVNSSDCSRETFPEESSVS